MNLGANFNSYKLKEAYNNIKLFSYHLKSLGAKEVSRDYFLNRLEKVNMNTIEHFWEIDNRLIN